jgi:hypothetical protein
MVELIRRQITPEIPETLCDDSYHTETFQDALSNNKQLLEAIYEGMKVFYGLYVTP